MVGQKKSLKTHILRHQSLIPHQATHAIETGELARLIPDLLETLSDDLLSADQ